MDLFFFTKRVFRNHSYNIKIKPWFIETLADLISINNPKSRNSGQFEMFLKLGDMLKIFRSRHAMITDQGLKLFYTVF